MHEEIVAGHVFGVSLSRLSKLSIDCIWRQTILGAIGINCVDRVYRSCSISGECAINIGETRVVGYFSGRGPDR